MDVSFIWQRDQKKHLIEVTSEQGLLTRFLNEEMQATDGDISFLQTFIDNIEGAVDLQIEFADWVVVVENEEVVVRPSSNLIESVDELQEGMSMLEQSDSVGKVDLVEALVSWQDFIQAETR